MGTGNASPTESRYRFNAHELKQASLLVATMRFLQDEFKLQFYRVGENYVCLCPFHKEDTPSFNLYIHPQTQEVTLHCYGCPWHGDIFNFLEKAKEYNLKQALEFFHNHISLDQEYQVTPVQRHTVSVSGTPVSTETDIATVSEALQEAAAVYHDYLLSLPRDSKPWRILLRRGVTEEQVELYKVGFCSSMSRAGFEAGRTLLNHLGTKRFFAEHAKFNLAGLLRRLDDEKHPYFRAFIEPGFGIIGSFSDAFSGRLTFPVTNNGIVVGLYGRHLANGRYRHKFSRGFPKKLVLYGLDQSRAAIATNKVAVLVEGIFDHLSMSHQVPYSVCSLGKDLTWDQASQLINLGITALEVMYDGDEAGVLGANTIREMLADTGITVDIWKLPELDPNEWFGGTNQPQKTMTPIRVNLDEPVPASGARVPIPKDYKVSAAALEPLLRYDAVSPEHLTRRITEVCEVIQSSTGGDVTIPRNFIDQGVYRLVGGALLLHLRLWIDQQRGKRRPLRTAPQLAEMIGCSDRTIRKYKSRLLELGFLEVERKGRYKAYYRVRFFPSGYRSALRRLDSALK